MTPYLIVRNLHIGIGVIALLSFWTTAVLRKGTPLHRRIGGVYLVAMVGIMATALPLAGAAFAEHHPVVGAFLLYLVLITGTAIWIAWRAIEDRRSFTRFMGVSYVPLAWTNILAGLGILAAGIAVGAPILYGLAPIGLLVGRQMLHLSRNPPTDRGWWLQRHYTAIIASGAATHIAFLNIGLQHLVPHTYSGAANLVAWFAPVITAGLALVWAHRRYGRGRDGSRLTQERPAGG
jgi:hypothetical protein